MEQLAHFVTKSFDFNNSRVLDLLNMTVSGGPGHHTGGRRFGSETDYGGRASDSDVLSSTSSSLGGDLEDDMHTHALVMTTPHQPRIPRMSSIEDRGPASPSDTRPPEVDEEEETIDIEITDLSYATGSGQSVNGGCEMAALANTSMAAALSASQTLQGLEPTAVALGVGAGKVCGEAVIANGNNSDVSASDSERPTEATNETASLLLLTGRCSDAEDTTTDRNGVSVIRKFDNKHSSDSGVREEGKAVSEQRPATTAVKCIGTTKKHVPRNWLIADLVDECSQGEASTYHLLPCLVPFPFSNFYFVYLTDYRFS